MDWPRVKSILIVSFLLLDLYLAWLLWSGAWVGLSSSLTDEDVQGLVALGQHYGVELAATPVPLRVGSVPTLSLLRPTAAAAEGAAATWLGAGATKTEPKAGSLVFTQGDRTLRATLQQFCLELELELPPPAAAGASADQEKSLALARQFLTEHLGEAEALLYLPGMVLPDAGSQGYVIELNRTYKGLPLFLDYYRVHVRNGQVTGFQACLSQLDQGNGGKQRLVTADRPMKRYLAQVGIQEERSLTILDFRLGYGLLPSGQETLQPVWRLTTNQAGQEEVFFPAGELYWEAENR